MSDQSQPKTLLHLSDTQFGKNHTFGIDAENPYDTLLQRLIEDLEKLEKREKLRPDCIIVTGDLVEWGLALEFKQIKTFLVGLCESLKLDRSRVILIPGNHDVNRKSCEAYFNQCEANETKPIKPYWPKWSAYSDFFNDFYADIPHFSFTNDTPWTLFELTELKMVIAGMNSTLVESHQDADHYGWLGEPQLKWFKHMMQSYAKQQWLRLGAVHHNIHRGATRDDENLHDADDFRNILASDLNLILHGHTHNGGVAWHKNAPIIATGSSAVIADVRPDQVPNQYQLVQVWRDKMKIWGRMFLSSHKQWIGDIRIDPDNDQWWSEHEVSFDQVENAFDPDQAAETLLKNLNYAQKLAIDLLDTLQHRPMVALLIQDHVEKGLVYLEIERGIKQQYTNYWHISPPAKRCTVDTYFQHLGRQLDSNQPVNNANDFHELFNGKLGQGRGLNCLLITGFEVGGDDGRDQLANILRSLTEEHSNLRVVVSGGQYLAEKINGAGALSMLNVAKVIRFPEISSDEVITQYHQMFPENNEITDETASRLLGLCGGHPVFLRECLQFWQEKNDFQHGETKLAKSPCILQFFLPFVEDAKCRKRVLKYLNRKTFLASHPNIEDAVLSALYWGNFLTFAKPGSNTLVWRGEVLRAAGLKFFQNYIKTSVPYHFSSCQIQNYFYLKNISVDHLQNKKEIYIVGENGDGKTLFLQALLLALRGNEGDGSIYDQTMLAKKYLREKGEGDLQIQLSATFDEQDMENIYNTLGPQSINPYIYVYAYGVHRHRWGDYTEADSRGYLTLFERNQSLYNPLSWLKQLDHAERSGERGLPVKVAKLIIKEILNQNIDITITSKEVIFTERGCSVSLDLLSEGYRSTIIWVCDLIKRLADKQPHSTSLSDFGGIVLVDEIDLHLHPVLEFSIVKKLRDWLPNIQFVFTTHSPRLILGSSEDAVFYKLYKENGETKIAQPLQSVKNMMANTLITSPLFNAESARARNNDNNVDTSDDYIESVIHKEIAKRLQENKGMTQAEILEQVLKGLDEYES